MNDSGTMTGAAPNRDEANGQRTRLWLTLIMATVTLVATAVGGAILYQVSFEQQRARLIALVRSQARLIESVARFDSIHSQEDHPEGALAATLSQVSEAYAQDDEFDSTGELILARREGEKIVFLMNRRYGNSDTPKPVRFESSLAEPMRRALNQQSGTMVGPDYRNVPVLAAYEPLKALNLALVAKIDLSEIRAPFLRAGAITGATALIFILLGAAFFHRISNSLILRLSSSVTNLNRAQRIAKLGNWDWNIVTGDLHWSDQIYRIFGLEPQQFGATYEAFLEAVHSDDRDIVEAAVSRALSEGEPYSIDHRIVLPDGKERIVHEQGEVNFDASGKPLRMSGTVQDVTGQRRAQEALRDSEEQFRVAFEQAGVGMALLALDGRWTRVNQQLCDMLGYSQEELLERRFHDLTHPDDLDANVRYLGQSLEGRIPAYAMEKRYFRKDGSIVWVNLTVALVRNAAGNPNHLVSVVEDISKRKQAEQDVHDLNEGLEQQVEARTAELRESEGRLALAIQSANFGTWSRNVPGDRVIWDERTEAIFGLEPGAFGGTMEAFLAQVHPDDRERIKTGHRRLIEEGVPYASDFRITWPNGEVRHIATRASVVRGDRDSSLQIIGMLHDITERKHTEEALRDSEEQLRLITDNVPAVIAYMDADQRYQFINKRYEEWFGISSVEAYGQRVRDVVGEVAYRAVEENLAKALSGKLVVFETVIPTKDAGTRDVQATYVPHFSDDGAVKGVFVLVTDISERKRLESELLRQGRLATLGQLTATVSHELRNPLGVIRTSAYTLRAGLNPDAPRAARALERVERSVVRCDRIIDELLDFTRITGLEPEPTPLDDWLAGVLEEQALPAGLVLHRDFGLPGTRVRFDRGRLRRAVINVFDNACQAMLGEEESKPAGGANSLTVRTRAHAGRVEVVFEDQGSGIPAEVYERIFEPLFSTKGFGVGLGLPVVKQIMEQHGGGIEVETEVGRGTTVRLWLEPEADIKGAAA